MQIKLEWYELLQGALVGIQRHVSALQQNKPDKYGFSGDGWGVHIEGALGELAAAKALNRFWSGSINTFKNGPDVGSKTQVRTRSQPNYDLLIRPDDPDDMVFVLVLGKAPVFDVAGWILGKDAKQPQWLQNHGGRPPAYFVPKEKLTSI